MSPTGIPAFRAANDRTLAFAERSNGRLVPFVRLDLTEEPLEEARRCLDLGARGIKLHPRAQRFQLNDERLSPIFAIAAERNVPILIHGGRGLPPIAAELRRLVESHPGSQLIIAHAGIADLGNLAACFAGKRGVFFDTSVWSAVDLLDFLHLVPPEQVVYASDYPYGRQPNSLLLALRTARIAGFSERGGPQHARRQRAPDRERRGAAGAVGAARARDVLAADGPRADPPVPLDGDAAALDAPAGHDRRARARAERNRGAQRAHPGRSTRSATS